MQVRDQDHLCIRARLFCWQLMVASCSEDEFLYAVYSTAADRPDSDAFAVLHHLVHVLHFIALLSEQVISPVTCVTVDSSLQALCLCGGLMLAPLLLHLQLSNHVDICILWFISVHNSSWMLLTASVIACERACSC